MRKGIVGIALVVGSLVLPAGPALAESCKPHNDPVELVKWLVCTAVGPVS